MLQPSRDHPHHWWGPLASSSRRADCPKLRQEDKHCPLLACRGTTKSTSNRWPRPVTPRLLQTTRTKTQARRRAHRAFWLFSFLTGRFFFSPARGFRQPTGGMPGLLWWDGFPSRWSGTGKSPQCLAAKTLRVLHWNLRTHRLGREECIRPRKSHWAEGQRQKLRQKTPALRHTERVILGNLLTAQPRP